MSDLTPRWRPFNGINMEHDIVIQNQYWTLRFALRMSNVMINAHNH